MLPCLWKQTLGVDCPGCGFQRSCIKLMEGDFYESLLLFPATIPFLLTLIFVALHLKFKFKHGARIIVILFLFTVFLIVLNFILKLIWHK